MEENYSWTTTNIPFKHSGITYKIRYIVTLSTTCLFAFLLVLTIGVFVVTVRRQIKEKAKIQTVLNEMASSDTAMHEYTDAESGQSLEEVVASENIAYVSSHNVTT